MNSGVVSGSGGGRRGREEIVINSGVRRGREGGREGRRVWS